MKNKPSIFTLTVAIISTSVYGAGYLQQQDFKSAADCIASGATVANCLLLDSQVYVTAKGLDESLSTAITNGDIGGGAALPTPAPSAAFLRATGTSEVWADLVSADIPNNAANTSGTAANLAGGYAIPTPTPSGDVLTANGSGYTWAAPSGGTVLPTPTPSAAFLRATGSGEVWADLVSADIPNNAANTSGNASTVTTNANLTGPIASSGNATSIAAQTGTGTTFAMQTSPEFLGTVGIGTTYTNSALGVNGGAAIGASSIIAGAPTGGLLVSGNVGIGNTAPTQKLSVAGTIQSTSGGVQFPDNSIQATSAVTNLLTNPNFQNSTVTTGWTTGGSGLAVTADTTNYLLPGSQSALLTFTSSTTGTFSQTVTPAQVAQYAGVNMEAQVWVKTSLATVQVCALVSGSTSGCVLAPSGNTFQPVSINFPANSSTTSFGIQIQTTGASTTGTVNAQLAYVGSATNLGLGGGLADATSYTPTISAGFGTPTNVSFFYKQVGDYAYISGTFTAGTVAGSIASVSLPTGLVLNTTKLGITGNTTSAAGTNVGGYANNVSNAEGIVITAPGTSTTLLYFGGVIGSATALTPTNGSTVSGTGTVFSFVAWVPIVGWTSSQSGYRADVTPANWSGDLNNTGAGVWSVTSSTQGDFGTSSITQALTTGATRNMTCTAAGSTLPGLTCTFPRTGNYQVCIATSLDSSAQGGSSTLYLTDGTTTFGQYFYNSPVANSYTPASFCRTYSATAGSATIKLQGKTNGGTLQLGPNNSAYGVTTSWFIQEGDAPMPASYLVGSVLSNSTANVFHVESAHFAGSTFTTDCGSGTCTLTGAYTPWVSVTWGSTGNYTATFPSGEFSAAPQCTFSCNCTGNNPCVASPSSAPSSTSYPIVINSSGAAQNGHCEMTCMGAH